MKSKTVLMSVILTSLFFACNKSGKADTKAESSVAQKDSTLSIQETVNHVTADTIDLSKVPFMKRS
jgi:hypothetical protein